MEQILTAIALACLVTSIFALKFRYWDRPFLLTGYFAVVLILEWLSHVYLIPADAFGPWLAILGFALTIGVIIAIRLVHLHEKRMNESRG